MIFEDRDFPVQIDEKRDDTAQFKNEGYVIIRRLIDPASCDRLTTSFVQEVKSHYNPSSKVVSCTNAGLVVCAFLNTLGFETYAFPDFRKAAIDILAGNDVQQLIAKTSGWKPTLIESTFWEASVGTPLHRDGDYVTSTGLGTMTGLWIALEDIGPDAGRLCIMPRDMTYLAAPRLDKGDAIIWENRIVHGSLPSAAGATRYSIAGHYIPSDDDLIRNGQRVALEYEIHHGMKLGSPNGG
jgi:ectoine hydroxylase-related dioxygenase (phytanoyl-CoA dioxygenase family)